MRDGLFFFFWGAAFGDGSFGSSFLLVLRGGISTGELERWGIGQDWRMGA
jgi:hypothetical protein